MKWQKLPDGREESDNPVSLLVEKFYTATYSVLLPSYKRSRVRKIGQILGVRYPHVPTVLPEL